MSDHTKLYFLKIKGEQYVQVERKRSRLRLLAVHRQQSKKNVYMTETENNKMALEFGLGKYSIKVENEQLQVVKKETNALPKECWFEKVDVKSSTYYGLRSVAEPNMNDGIACSTDH